MYSSDGHRRVRVVLRTFVRVPLVHFAEEVKSGKEVDSADAVDAAEEHDAAHADVPAGK